MKKSEIQIVPDFYKGYISLAPDQELMEVLPTGGIQLYQDNIEMLNAIGLKTYAKGKWTVNEIIEHLMDTERIFLARALRFVRNDKTDLPGYDEDFYAENSRSNERSIEDLLGEYQIIRKSTTLFYQNLNEEELLSTGTANNKLTSVLAMGFIQIGHPIHHFNVIEERYKLLI